MGKRTVAVPTGPLATYASGFRAWLREVGYSRSAAKRHLNLMVHLDRWLQSEGLEAQGLVSDAVEAFFAARREQRRSNLLTVRSLVPLVGLVYRQRSDPSAGQERLPDSPIQALVDRFGCLSPSRPGSGRRHGQVLRTHRSSLPARLFWGGGAGGWRDCRLGM